MYETNFFLTIEKARRVAEHVGTHVAEPVRVALGYRVRVYCKHARKRYFRTYIEA